MSDLTVKIETIDQFRPQQANPNKHNPRGLAALDKSMSDVGYVAPMTATADGEIIDGSARLEIAALRFGDEVIVIEHDGTRPIIAKRTDVPDAQSAIAKRISYSANRIAEIDLTWDIEQLAADIEAGVDLDGLWSDDELADLINGITSSADSSADDGRQIERAAELAAKWQTERGAIYQVGRHRVMCGDSSDASAVEVLLNGATVDIVITDPPYDMSAAMVRQCLINYANRAVVLAGGKLPFSLCVEGWEYSIDLVWRHRQPRSFATPYQPVFYHNNVVIMTSNGAKSGWKRPNKGFPSVFEIDGVEYPDTEYGHGKSVEVFVQMMRGFAWKTWADPFLGTGASLLACEQRGATCYAMELDPGITGVALERISASGLEVRRVEA